MILEVRLPAPSAPVYYAGIGSRDTPMEIQRLMGEIAGNLAALGLTLRSGGAAGADTAFSRAVKNPDLKQIFTPWRKFIPDPAEDARALPVTEEPMYGEALRIAAEHHPYWPGCSQGARKLHARNVMQVLGSNLCTPSDFVLCWTKDGRASGGTGQAMRVAAAYNVPVLNLKNPEELEAVVTGVSRALVLCA